MDDLEWRWSTFDALSAREVHDLLRLRAEVFVVEQACVFSEIDGRDPDALHLRALTDGRLAGCLRVFAPEADGAPAVIGRIATRAEARGRGLGHALMTEALRFLAERHPGAAAELSAQAHLAGFYGSHGFRPVSETYLEDGIPHVDMRRPAATTSDRDGEVRRGADERRIVTR